MAVLFLFWTLGTETQNQPQINADDSYENLLVREMPSGAS